MSVAMTGLVIILNVRNIMDIYSSPNSNLYDGKLPNIGYWRSVWVLIPINMYVWWKLYDYIDLYIWSIGNSTFIQMVELSIGIPVYIASLLYIFCIKIPFRKLWQVVMVLELGDHIRGCITHYSGIADFMVYDLPVYPIYVIGLMYAFGLKGMWLSSKKWGRVNPKEYRLSALENF